MKDTRSQLEFLREPAAVALVAALRAGAQVTRRVRADAPRLTKEDRSPVTVADFAVQAVVSRSLSQAFEGLRLVAEEDTRSFRRPGGAAVLAEVVGHVRSVFAEARPEDVSAWIDLGSGSAVGDFWTLDPIDGTKGFLRGGHYAVALARIERGEVVLAGLACPTMRLEVAGLSGAGGVLAIAFRGRGSWAQPLAGGGWVRLKTSDVDDPRRARWLRSVEGAHTDERWLEGLIAELGLTREAVRMDSQAKYLAVAAGEGDLIFRLLPSGDRSFRERIWDQAAGALLVEEAGGRVTDLAGGRLDFGAGVRLERNIGVLTSNGRLHARAIDALRRVPQP